MMVESILIVSAIFFFWYIIRAVDLNQRLDSTSRQIHDLIETN